MKNVKDYNIQREILIKTPIKQRDTLRKIKRVSSSSLNVLRTFSNRQGISPCSMKKFENRTRIKNIENFDELINAIGIEPEKRDSRTTESIKEFFQKENILENLQKDKMHDCSSSDFLYELFANNLQVHYLQKHETLFRLHDIGDRFYVILKGQIGILIPDKQKKNITRKEYVDLLNEHLYKKDIALINMTLGANMVNVNFDSYEDFILYNTVKEKQKLFDEINLIRENMFDLHNFFKQNKERLVKFDICKEFSEINFLGGKLKEKMEEKFLEHLKRIDFNANINSKYLFSKRRKTNDENIKEYHEKKEIEDMEREKFFLKNEMTIVYEYRQEILKKFDLSESQKLIKKKYEQMEDDIEKLTYFVYNYLELPAIGPKKYFGDLALDSLKNERKATIRANSYCVLGSISKNIYRENIYKFNQESLTAESLYLHGNNFFKMIPITNFRNRYFKYFNIETISKNEVLTNNFEESSKIFFLKSGTIDISIFCSYKEINDFLKIIIVQGYKEGIYDSNEFKLHLKKLIANVYEQDLLDEESKKLNEKRNFNILTLNAGEIIGIESLLYDCLSPYKSVVVSESAKVFSIEKSDFLYVIKSNPISRQNYFNYSFIKMKTLIERLNHVKKLGYKDIRDKSELVAEHELQIFFQKTIKNFEDVRKNKKFDYLFKYQKEFPLNSQQIENQQILRKGLPEIKFTNEVDYNESKIARKKKKIRRSSYNKENQNKVKIKNEDDEDKENNENNENKSSEKKFSTTPRIISLKEKENSLNRINDQFVRIRRKSFIQEANEVSNIKNNLKILREGDDILENSDESNTDNENRKIETLNSDENGKFDTFNSEKDENDLQFIRTINKNMENERNKKESDCISINTNNSNSEKLRGFYMNKKLDENRNKRFNLPSTKNNTEFKFDNFEVISEISKDKIKENDNKRSKSNNCVSYLQWQKAKNVKTEEEYKYIETKSKINIETQTPDLPYISISDIMKLNKKPEIKIFKPSSSKTIIRKSNLKNKENKVKEDYVSVNLKRVNIKRKVSNFHTSKPLLKNNFEVTIKNLKNINLDGCFSIQKN